MSLKQGSRGNVLTRATTIQERNKCPWGTWDIPHSAVEDGDEVETWMFSTTPHFHQRVRRGDLLPHNGYFRQRRRNVGLGSSQAVQWPNGCQASWAGPWITDIFNFYPTPPEPATPDLHPDFLSQRAAASFFSRNTADVGTFLAESAKLIGPFQGLVRSFASLATKGAFNATSLHEYLDVWLSVRYGLRPLLRDLENFDRALKELGRTKKSLFIKARATETAQISGYSNPYTFSDANQYWQARWNYSGTAEASFNIVGELNPTRLTFDPAKTAWELVKWSFVIDWFYTVADWLDTIRLVNSNLNFVSSYSTKIVYSAVPVISGREYRNGMTGQMVTFYGTHLCTTLTRSPMGVKYDMPTKNARPLSALHTADFIALVLQPWVAYMEKRWSYIPFTSLYRPIVSGRGSGNPYKTGDYSPSKIPGPPGPTGVPIL